MAKCGSRLVTLGKEKIVMNDRMLLGILFLVGMFIFISIFLFKLLGVFAIPFIAIVGISGVAGWRHGGKKDNYKG